MTPHTLLKRITKLTMILMMGVSMSACSGDQKWKEEVLLHDGSKLIVERSQSYGGRHEIGQRVPIKEHKISFTLPEAHEFITWETTIGMDSNDSSLGLLALDIVKGVPYIVTSMLGCHAYNKWGRPNPPYVFFKYDGKTWQRIPIEKFPTEIKAANVVIDMAKYSGILSAEEVKKINGTLQHEVMYLQVFVREKIKSADLACPEFE